jgi:flagellar hook assembly protein FlgD
LGRRVAALLDEKRPAGVHLVRWDASDEAGNQVATGIYFYRLQATPADGRRAFQSVRKMVVQ